MGVVPTTREGVDLTILVQFGNKTMASTGGNGVGPVEEPDPGTDRNWDGSPTDNNSTYWIRTSNTAHYKNA